MNLRKCVNKKERMLYKKFIKELYQNDKQYRDYITPAINELFRGKSSFSKGLFYEAFILEDKNNICGVMFFLIPERDNTIMQIGFLEYRELEGIASFILEEAKKWSSGRGIEKIVVGLNGHVNYGLGLSEKNEKIPTFGSSYTKPYYIKDFEKLGGKVTKLTTYEISWNTEELPFSDRWAKRLENKVEYRVMTAKTFKKDMALYTKLNNSCFQNHPFYYERRNQEDYEFFSELRFFLEKGSLIFAEKEGIPIGFFLWYPDWSIIMKPGETASAITFIKILMYRKKVKTFKLVEWAVLPEYQGKGVPFGMLHHCFGLVKDKGYLKCKTSWILDENKNSNGFTKKWGKEDEHFRVFEF